MSQLSVYTALKSPTLLFTMHEPPNIFFFYPEVTPLVWINIYCCAVPTVNFGDFFYRLVGKVGKQHTLTFTEIGRFCKQWCKDCVLLSKLLCEVMYHFHQTYFFNQTYGYGIEFSMVTVFQSNVNGTLFNNTSFLE